MICGIRHWALKIAGRLDIYEARIDTHYRMTFQKTEDSFVIRNFGPHDEGLEKK